MQIEVVAGPDVLQQTGIARAQEYFVIQVVKEADLREQTVALPVPIKT